MWTSSLVMIHLFKYHNWLRRKGKGFLLLEFSLTSMAFKMQMPTKLIITKSTSSLATLLFHIRTAPTSISTIGMPWPQPEQPFFQTAVRQRVHFLRQCQSVRSWNKESRHICKTTNTAKKKTDHSFISIYQTGCPQYSTSFYCGWSCTGPRRSSHNCNFFGWAG